MLQEAMAARTVILQAEGVLMGRYRISAAAAHRMLRDISQRSGRPIRQVAGDVSKPRATGSSLRKP
jgi:AmiR/NasT family two-component response regulator